MDASLLNIEILTEDDMAAFGAKFIQVLKPGSVVYLHGQLGAGKTTLVRSMLRSLGFQDKVKSPTYTLVESYEIKNLTLYHFDLYRVQDAEELEFIGIQEYFSPTAICVIEWPEKGFPVLPKADIDCYIEIKAQHREVSLKAFTPSGAEMLTHLQAAL